MKIWLLRISVILCAVALLPGSWLVWRMHYAGGRLFEAVVAGDIEEARTLLAWGARPDEGNKRGWDIWRKDLSGQQILDAVLAEDTRKARTLIILGAALDAREKHWDRTLLHLVCDDTQDNTRRLKGGRISIGCGIFPIRYNYEIAMLLIAHGADVNSKDYWGETPLHYIARSKRKASLEIAEALIKHGADVDVKSPIDDSTPLLYAHSYKNEGMISVLRKH